MLISSMVLPERLTTSSTISLTDFTVSSTFWVTSDFADSTDSTKIFFVCSQKLKGDFLYFITVSSTFSFTASWTLSGICFTSSTVSSTFSLIAFDTSEGMALIRFTVLSIVALINPQLRFQLSLLPNQVCFK